MKRVFYLLPILFLIYSCNNSKNTLQPETGIAEVNGTKLYYELAGAGECIVFIHGNFGDCRLWDNQFELFAKKYKVLRYDVRGYGKSAMPVKGEKYSPHNDLRALLDYLKIEKATFCRIFNGEWNCHRLCCRVSRDGIFSYCSWPHCSRKLVTCCNGFYS